MVRRRCHFAGRVQGVGFRYTTQSLARDFAVGGFVRNLSDGTVELIVEGEASEVERFVDAVSREFSSQIQSVDTRQEPATHEFRGFEIRR
ncbi:MAG: acylphosphatase [Tepidisphaeraceae bacterium]